MITCGSRRVAENQPLSHFAGPSYILQRWRVERSAEDSEYECKDALIHSLSTDEIQKWTCQTMQSERTFSGRLPSGFPSALRRDKSIRVSQKNRPVVQARSAYSRSYAEYAAVGVVKLRSYDAPQHAP